MFDPGSMSVTANWEASKSSGASGSTTGLTPQALEMGGKGDPQALGVRGSETQRPGTEAAARSSEAREQAGVE